MNRLLALIVLVLLAATTANAKERSPLRVLRDQKHLDGAGCYLHAPGSAAQGADVFQWNLLSDAWINVGGTDIKLTRVSFKQVLVRKDKSSVGDRSIATFSAQGYKVVVETKVTKTCPEDDESCEVWSEQGTITVTSGRKSWSARGTGECGS